MNAMYALSKNISQLRKEGGYSRRHVAETIGINVNTIRSIERYQKRPSKYDIRINTLCRLADFFQVTTDYLVGRASVDTTHI